MDDKMTFCQQWIWANIFLLVIVLQQFELSLIECSEQIIVGRPLQDDSDTETNNRIITIDDLGNLKLQEVRRDPKSGSHDNFIRNEPEHQPPSIGDHSLADILAFPPNANISAANQTWQDTRAETDAELLPTKNDDNGRENEADATILSEPKIEGKSSLSVEKSASDHSSASKSTGALLL